MDLSSKMKKYIQQISEGNIHEVLTSLKEGDIKLNTKYSIRIIISVCSVCNKFSSNPQRLCDEDVLDIINFTLSTIEEPSETNIYEYYVSIFHVIKLFCAKMNLEILFKMKKVFLPDFIPDKFTAEQLSVYSSLSKMLFNMLLQICRSKNEVHYDKLTTLGKLIALLNVRILDQDEFLESAINCIKCFIMVELEVDMNYFTYILKLAKINGASKDTTYLKLLHLFDVILRCGLTTFKFKYAEAIFLGVKEILKNAPEEYLYMIDLFYFVILLSPETEKCDKYIGSCITSLNKLFRIITNDNFIKTGEIIRTLSSCVVQYYLSHENLWFTMDDHTQIQLMNFLFKLGKLMSLNKCADSCNSESNLYYFSKICYQIFALISTYVKNISSIKESYKNTCFTYLEYLIQNQYHLVAKNCSLCKTEWIKRVSKTMYNVAFYFHKENHKICTSFFKFLIKCILCIEDDVSQSVILQNCLNVVSLDFLNDKNYEHCMAVVALYVYFLEERKDVVLNRWICAKAALREDESIQKTTLCTAFEKFKPILSDYCVLLILENVKIVELLKFELELYKQKWNSKISMKSVLMELYDVGDVEILVKIIIKIFSECDLQVDKSVPELFSKVLKRLNTEIDSKRKLTICNKLDLAYFYYIYFSYCFKEEIVKNCDEIEKAMLIQSQLDSEVLEIEPDEKCDVISAYESLKLENHIHTIKYLNEALKLIVTFDGKNKYNTMYKLLINIAFDYHLHMHNIPRLQALELALKLSKEEKHMKNIVESISYIIENCDISKAYIKSLIEEAELCITSLVESSDAEDVRTVLTYYISKCKAYFYKDHLLAFECYKKAKSLLEQQENTSDFKIISIQMFVLHYKFVMLPCSLSIIDHSTETFFKMPVALCKWDPIQNVKVNSYQLSLKLDIYEECTQMYNRLKMPRQVRCYGKYPFKLTQEMIIPLRSVSYLICLAYSDILTNNYDDCQVKLDGIADILCVSSMNIDTSSKDSPSEFIPTNDDSISQLTNQLGKVMIDVSRKGIEIETCPSSPTFQAPRFKLPHFIKHSKNCTCFYCMNLNYQKFILLKIWLKGLIYVSKNNLMLAREYLQGGLYIYEIIKKNFKSYSTKVDEKIHQNLLPEFTNLFLDVQSLILYEYNRLLLSLNFKEEALHVNTILLENLLPRKYQLFQIYTDTLVLRLKCMKAEENKKELIQNSFEENNDKNEVPVTPKSKESKVLCTVKFNDVTPEFKDTKVSFTTNMNGYFKNHSKTGRRPKPIRLDLSPSESESTSSNNSKIPKHSTPLRIEQVDEQVNRVRKLNNSPKDIKNVIRSVSKSKTATTSTQNKTVTKSVVSETNIDIGLRSKTKQLTSKLKLSNKENCTNINKIKNNDPVSKCVRKKLLDDLEAIGASDYKQELSNKRLNVPTILITNTETGASTAEIPKHTGAVRKSTRNKK